MRIFARYGQGRQPVLWLALRRELAGVLNRLSFTLDTLAMRIWSVDKHLQGANGFRWQGINDFQGADEDAEHALVPVDQADFPGECYGPFGRWRDDPASTLLLPSPEQADRAREIRSKYYTAPTPDHIKDHLYAALRETPPGSSRP